MAGDLIVLSPDADRQIAETVRAVRGLTGQRPVPGRNPQSGWLPPIAFVLLEDLQTGGRAKAVLLKSVDPHEVKILTVRGEPEDLRDGVVAGEDDSTFRLKLPGGETEEISWSASAATVRRQLERIEGLRGGDVVVGLGRIAKPEAERTGAPGEETEYVLGRWLIEFGGRFEAIDPPLLQVVDNMKGAAMVDLVHGYFCQATGEIVTVRSVIPTELPSEASPSGEFDTGSPIHRGSIGTAKGVPGIGYVIDALECRHFDPQQRPEDPYY